MSAWIAWLLVAVGGGVSLLTMSSDRTWAFGVEVGFVGVALCSFGLLRLVRGLGTTGGNGTAEGGPTEAALGDSIVDARALAAPGGIWLLSTLGFWGVIYLAVLGVFPMQRVSAGLLVTGGFVLWVIATFQLGRRAGIWARDELGVRRGLLNRFGFWLLVLGALLYLPMLGNFGLIDPWETHYGEVAREMLARDDWISLWWAQDGWFWSKPILNFWLQGLAFKVFGVAHLPDQMVLSVTSGRWPQPEWAARLPLYLMTVLSGYVLYRACVRPFGERRAFLGGFVLLTCPYWFLLARQTMADMPYVAPLTAALAFLLLGFQTPETQQVTSVRVRFGSRVLQLNAFHVLFAAVLLCVIPQVLYLLSRNLTLHLSDPFGFRLHVDELFKGSGGENCGQPGNPACGPEAVRVGWGQPGYFAILWSACLGLWLFLNRRETRQQRLFFLAAWFCTALAAMAKGAPGLVLPIAVALVYVGVTGRFRELLRLEFLSLVLLILALVLPWYVQMFMRHGPEFTDRLILHDMFKRAFDHVHDTNKGDDTSFRYYLWQLGYGLFPWTGFAAGGLIWWARRRQRSNDPHSSAALFFMIWWFVAFGMFSISNTKFHHYILPLVPPTAALSGVLLAHFVPRRLSASWTRTALYAFGMLSGTGLLYYGVLRSFPGSLLGYTIDGDPLPAKLWLGVLLGVLGALVLIASVRFGAPPPLPAQPAPSDRAAARRSYVTATLSVLAIIAAVGIVLAGRDLFTTQPGDLVGPIRLLHLFTYNYERAWPSDIDFSGAIRTFTIVCALACVLLCIPRWRRHAGVMVCALACLWTVWVSDVYLVRLSPHWGQRETIVAYLQHRASPDEPLVAYQMNWKGENFYTGNRMATFVSSGKKFKRWIEKQRAQGLTTFFFTTEHSRIESLKRELEGDREFELLTDQALNNKFVLARAIFEPSPEKASDGTPTTKANGDAPAGAKGAPKGAANKRFPTPKLNPPDDEDDENEDEQPSDEVNERSK
jgi:4-amino-4-deoxy-L-arabinose transferase-like glycosyltransferase